MNFHKIIYKNKGLLHPLLISFVLNTVNFNIVLEERLFTVLKPNEKYLEEKLALRGLSQISIILKSQLMYWTAQFCYWE